MRDRLPRALAWLALAAYVAGIAWMVSGWMDLNTWLPKVRERVAMVEVVE